MESDRIICRKKSREIQEKNCIVITSSFQFVIHRHLPDRWLFVCHHFGIFYSFCCYYCRYFVYRFLFQAIPLHCRSLCPYIARPYCRNETKLLFSFNHTRSFVLHVVSHKIINYNCTTTTTNCSWSFFYFSNLLYARLIQNHKANIHWHISTGISKTIASLCW